MTWSVHWALTRWSTSCCLFPLALQPTRTSSDWWPTHRTEWCTPEPASWWWTRTSRYLLPCETRTWRECCSPHRRYGNPTRTAWRSEPSPTAKTEASSTRRPSSSISPSLPTPTESTLNDVGQRCGDGLRPPHAAPPGWTREWVWFLGKVATSVNKLRKKRLCVQYERDQWVQTAPKT